MKYKDINFNLDFGNFNPEDIDTDETINAVFIVDTSPSITPFVKDLNKAFNDFYKLQFCNRQFFAKESPHKNILFFGSLAGASL